MNTAIDPAKFEKYMKKKEAFLKIYEASSYPVGKKSISLTHEECALLMSLFEQNKVIGFVA